MAFSIMQTASKLAMSTGVSALGWLRVKWTLQRIGLSISMRFGITGRKPIMERNINRAGGGSWACSWRWFGPGWRSQPGPFFCALALALVGLALIYKRSVKRSTSYLKAFYKVSSCAVGPVVD